MCFSEVSNQPDKLGGINTVLRLCVALLLCFMHLFYIGDRVIKIILLLVASLCVSPAYSSKLSKYLNKVDAESRAQQQREWQQDMNFADLDFRLDRHFSDETGQQCREYMFRARSNPYRHGPYIVCDER